MRFCKLFFPALAAGILLFLAAGASLAAGPPDGSASSVTDNTTGAVPSATDNVTGAVPSASDNATGAVPSSIDNVIGAAPPAADNTWVDRTHSLVERNLFDTVVWFDHFFGDERIVVSEWPESYMRWVNDLRWDEEERFSARSRIRASLRLPRLKKRWRLVISGETRGDPNALTQEDPGNPGLDVGSRVRTGSTELVYDILRTPRSTLDAGAGVRVKIPPDAFVRTRFQHARPIAFKTLGRFTATAFWDARDGFGESNQVDLERWLALPTLLRWSNSFNISENKQRVDVGDGALPPPQAFPEKRDHLRRGRLGLDPSRVDRTELPGPDPVPPERLPEMALPRGGTRRPLAEEGRREPETGVGSDAAGGDPVRRGGTDSVGRWRERALTPEVHAGDHGQYRGAPGNPRDGGQRPAWSSSRRRDPRASRIPAATGISRRATTRATTPLHPARRYARPLAVIPAVPPR